MPTLFTMSATVHHNVCVSFGVRCPTMLDDDARSSLELDISGFGKMQHTQMRRYRRDSIAICTNFGAYISMSEWMSEIYISGVYRLWLAFHVLCTFPWTKRYFHFFEAQCRCEGGHSSATIGKPKYGLFSAFYAGFFDVGTLTHIVDSHMRMKMTRIGVNFIGCRVHRSMLNFDSRWNSEILFKLFQIICMLNLPLCERQLWNDIRTKSCLITYIFCHFPNNKINTIILR